MVRTISGVARELVYSIDLNSVGTMHYDMARWLLRQLGGTVTNPRIRRIYVSVLNGAATAEERRAYCDWLMSLTGEVEDEPGEEGRAEVVGGVDPDRRAEVEDLQAAEESSDGDSVEGSDGSTGVGGFEFT